MPETTHEFTVVLNLDAREDADTEVEELLYGTLELQHNGQWMLLGDALAEWLLHVLPGQVNSASVAIKPTERWHGVVTATMLNVRAQPGAHADNPIVAKLPQSSEVQVFGEQLVDGEKWLRIGPDRWVHSEYILSRDMGGAGGVSTPGKTRPVTGKKSPRKAVKGGSAKPVSPSK